MGIVTFVLGFLGVMSIPCVIIGMFGDLYSICRNEKYLNFFSKLTIYSLLVLIFTFGLLIYFNS